MARVGVEVGVGYARPVMVGFEVEGWGWGGGGRYGGVGGCCFTSCRFCLWMFCAMHQIGCSRTLKAFSAEI